MTCAYCGVPLGFVLRDTSFRPLCVRCAENPSWWEIMGPIASSPLMRQMRRAATAYLERDAGPDFGISSSDINHTLYSAGKNVRAAYGTVDPVKVLELLEEGAV